MKKVYHQIGIWFSVASALAFPDKKAIAAVSAPEPKISNVPDIRDDKPVYLERARELYGDATSFKFAGHRSHSSHRSHASHASHRSSSVPSVPKEEPVVPQEEPAEAVPSPSYIPKKRPALPPAILQDSQRLLNSRGKPDTNKGPSEEHVSAGLAASKRGNYDEAIGHYYQAIAKEPANFMAHNNLGVAYYKKGEIVGAKEHLMKSIEINPKYADAYYNMGVIHLDEGNTEGAIFNLGKSCELGLADACKKLNNIKKK
jgi:tetratricopeptide (TPR) repeat protein